MKYSSFAAIVVFLAACCTPDRNDRVGDADATDPILTPAGAATSSPFDEAYAPDRRVYTLASDTLDVDVSFPARHMSLPAALQKRLWTQAADITREAITVAAEDADWAAADGYDFNPHFLEIEWSEVGPRDRDLISLVAEISTYTGGAHPNFGFDIVNWDVTSDRELGFSDVFMPEDAALSALSSRLRSGLLDAKKERLEGFYDEENALGYVEPVVTPELENYESFALVDADGDASIDAVRFYYSPYSVGPWAEGAYTIDLPVEDLATVLSERIP